MVIDSMEIILTHTFPALFRNTTVFLYLTACDTQTQYLLPQVGCREFSLCSSPAFQLLRFWCLGPSSKLGQGTNDG